MKTTTPQSQELLKPPFYEESEFNNEGKLHSKQHLDAMYPGIIEMETEKQAEYVDMGTYKNYTLSFIRNELPHVTRKVYNRLNATSIGNVAFLALYSPNHMIRSSHALFLKAMKDYHTTHMNKKSFWYRLCKFFNI